MHYGLTERVKQRNCKRERREGEGEGGVLIVACLRRCFMLLRVRGMTNTVQIRRRRRNVLAMLILIKLGINGPQPTGLRPENVIRVYELRIVELPTFLPNQSRDVPRGLMIKKNKKTSSSSVMGGF